MAKEGQRVNVQMKSSESAYSYFVSKNKRNTTERLELKKYDPLVRKHVTFKEKK